MVLVVSSIDKISWNTMPDKQSGAYGVRISRALVCAALPVSGSFGGHTNYPAPGAWADRSNGSTGASWIRWLALGRVAPTPDQ